MRQVVVSLLLFLALTTPTTECSADFIFKNDIYVEEPETVDEIQKIFTRLTQSQVPSDISTKQTVLFVLYYAQWCPHCHQFAPIWSMIGSSFFCKTDVSVAAFECSHGNQSRESTSSLSPGKFCRNEQIDGYPTPRVYWNEIMEDGTVKLHKANINPSKSLTEIRDWILANTPVTDYTACNELPNLKENIIRKLDYPDRWPATENEWCPDIRLHDAIASFGFLLRNWVTNRNIQIQASNFLILKDILNMAAPLLPGKTLQMNLLKISKQLDANMSTIRYHELLDEIGFLSGIEIKKKGASPKFYQAVNLSSGLWMFFHILTVSLDESNSPRLDKEDSFSFCNVSTSSHPSNDTGYEKSDIRTKPDQIALLIFKIVDTFFRCQVCRQHFTHAYRKCSTSRCEWVPENFVPKDRRIADAYQGSVLWLWRFHNTVTFRTALEVTSDVLITASFINDVPTTLTGSYNNFEGSDVRFPPSSLCTTCHLSRDKIPMISHFGEPLTPDSFKLSSALVNESVEWEKYKRGLRNNAPNTKVRQDYVLDKFEDYDIDSVTRFLHAYYWKREWNNRTAEFVWNDDMKVFSSPAKTSIARYLLGRKEAKFQSECDRSIAKSMGECMVPVVVCSGFIGLLVLLLKRGSRKLSE